MLTILASLAQQESENISRNVKLGLKFRYQKGFVMVNGRQLALPLLVLQLGNVNGTLRPS